MERSSKFLILLSSLVIGVLVFNNCIASTNAEKEIPSNIFMSGPTMTFLYCYSCGYRKAFEEYAAILTEKYPDISIRGANYDPPGLNLYLSRGVLITKILLIFVLISNFDLWAYFGQANPSWWNWCTTNKLYACMMIFFVGNMIEAQLISSGAFEISFNDVPVWSKLQTGRIPAPQELFQIIDNQLKFSQPSLEANPNFVK